MPRKPRITLTDLPTDVLSCIAHHLRKDVGQQDGTLDDIAALRSVCRSLRHVLDHTATHANLHPHIHVAVRVTDELKVAVLQFSIVPLQLHNVVTCTCVLHGTAACPSAQKPGHHRCELPAGLQHVRLQALQPDTAASTLEALTTLEHLRSLDMP
jgi:hypothetical protein